MTRILANTCAIGYSYIDEEFAKTIGQVLEIESQRLIKPKQIQSFDGKAVKFITYAIWSILTVGIHIESVAFLLITDLENHSMILDWLWIKKYKIIIIITNDFLAF